MQPSLDSLPVIQHLRVARDLLRSGDRVQAFRAVETAVATLPRSATGHFLGGMILDEVGCREMAAARYAACIALDPARADAHHRYGRALESLGRFSAAIDSFTTAVRLCGSNAAYFVDLSSALSALGRFEEVRLAAEVAVSLDPNSAEGHNNLGHALLNLNRSAEALAPYERAIALRPDYAKAQFGYALALLKSGDFARGWRQYEWRWQDCQRPRQDLAAPLWQGEDLRGRTILLHAEQGFGDTLQFVRFAPLLAARGARVVLEVPRALVRLLRGVDGVAKVIAAGRRLPPVDVHCPLASLPLAFDLRLGTIPAAPYLPAPRRRKAHAGRPLVVGLVWAGDPRKWDLRSNLIDRRRSTTLAMFAPLLAIEGIRFLGFQLGEARDQIADWPSHVTDAMEGVTDFADTAARLADVDLLISVDTAMVHLAGGMGVPVWMLSRADACWRWLEGRADTPWYPTMRIFRQPAPGDWAAMLADVGTALARLVHDKRAHGLPRARPHHSAATAPASRSASKARVAGSNFSPYSIASSSGSKPRIRNVVTPSA